MESKCSEGNLLDAYKVSSNNIIKSIDEILNELSPDNNNKNDDSNNKVVVQELIENSLIEITSLKYYQRSICTKLEKDESIKKEYKCNLNKNLLLLQSLEYEREYLNKQISICKEYNPCTLAEISREEMIIIDDNDNDGNTTTVTTPTAKRQRVEEDTTKGIVALSNDKIIDKYLSEDTNSTTTTASYRNSNQHAKNIQKLKNEVTERKHLITLLNKQNIEYNESNLRIKNKKKFLNDLPNKLNSIEKASLPLQEYFHSNSGDSADNTEMSWMGSSEKRRRVREAQELIGPLYVLCGQIQAYIDAFPIQGKNESTSTSTTVPGRSDVVTTSDVSLTMDIIKNNTETTLPLTTNGSSLDIHPTSIKLELSCPSINKDIYRIYFQYSTKLNVVVASTILLSNSSLIKSVKPCKELLINLFPSDDGLTTPNLSNYHLDDFKNVTFDICRPYHWLQCIAGLSFISDATTSSVGDTNKKERILEPSTQSVICQLKRRVRAQCTLSNILSILEKKPEVIPTHPNFTLPLSIVQLQEKYSANNCRIVSWTELSQPPSNFVFYSAQTDQQQEDTQQYCRYFYTKIKKNYSLNKNSLSSSFIDNIVLDVYVQLRPEYPYIPPYFILQISTSSTTTTNTTTNTTTKPDDNNKLYEINLKTLQTFINTYHVVEQDQQEQDNNNMNDCILNHQLYLLISCWNIFRMSDVPNFGFLDGIRMHRGKNRNKSFMS